MTFRPPIIVTIYARQKAQSEYVVNFLPQIAPNPAQPFIQSDWPSPVLGKPKIIVELFGTLNVLLTPNPAVPFNQYEWRLTARIPLSLKSDVQGGVSPLLTPNPAQPFRQSLWEGAAKPWPKAIGEAIGGDTPLLTPNPVQPFYQSDWYQIRVTQKAKVDDVTNLLPVHSIPPGVPTSQNDWPNAKLLSPTTEDTVNLLLALFLNPIPFVNSTEIRIFTKLTVQYDTFANRLPLTSTPVTPSPFYLTDWPNAVVPSKPAKVDTVALLLPLYSPFNPFANSTESRIFAVQSVKSDIIINLLPLNSAPVVGAPFAESDWSVAVLARQKIAADSTGPIPPLYFPNPARPFNLADWPIPASPGKVQASDAEANIFPAFHPNPASPFGESDWALASYAQGQHMPSPFDVPFNPNLYPPLPPVISPDVHGLQFHVTMGKLKSF